MHAGSGSDWESFNRKAEEVLNEDPVEKKELIKIFRQIEDLVFSGVNYVLQSTTFVEDNLCYLLAEIASGTIKSRKVYKGKRVRRRVSLDSDIEMGSENRRIFGIGFDLFKLSRTERPVAIPLIKRTIRTLRVSTNTYENILVAFSKEGKKYCQASNELARKTLELRELNRLEDPDEDRIAGLKQDISFLIDQLDLIELNVGCVEPNCLYGTVMAVESVLEEVQDLQEKILRAYSRLVLRPVRDRAQSEMEAFDLFQSGNLGLARAISLYDVRSGTSFSTFATWWIRQKIFGHLKHSGQLIKLPASVWEAYQKIKTAERHFESDPEKRDSYTDEDIAVFCRTSVKSIELVRKKIQSTKIVSLESLRSAQDDESDSAASDTATDRALIDNSVELAEDDANIREFVESVLDHLDGEHRNLVCLRYGIIDSVKTDIDPDQAIQEVYRQASCKAILQNSMAIATERRISSPRVEELPDA